MKPDDAPREQREPCDRRGQHGKREEPWKESDHPRLSDREDREQRGEDPKDSVGPPRPKVDDQEDPHWQPDPRAADPWRGLIREWGREHRPNREDVLPYLLIRAVASGDRAVRPLWPPTPFWLSPDILLIDGTWTGPFDRARVVGSPVAGRSYRLFVHAWNLGLLPAVGVHLRAWHVAPGFFSGQPGYAPQLIGGSFFDLAPRTAPGAHRIVEVMPAWYIPPQLTGHECLLASIECPADRWSGALDANNDRHVGQRNISILEPAADLAPLLATLGRALASDESIEVTLDTRQAKGAIEYGVPISGGSHLLVGVMRDDVLLTAPTTALARLLGEALPSLSVPGTAARLFGELAPRLEGRLWAVGLDRAFGRLLGTDKLTVENVLATLGGDGPRTLQLVAFTTEWKPVGGYSIRMERGPNR
jgi:hypothetical protein